jgi:hypothetical protein
MNQMISKLYDAILKHVQLLVIVDSRPHETGHNLTTIL